jgi:tetratricopeptide (TPR) repeat protein
VSQRAIIVSVAVFLIGIVALILMFTLGRGDLVYVPDEAVKHREMGEFLLNKRRHTTDKTQKAELLTQAMEEFKKALAIKQDFDVALNMLGHCYIERGQWDAALKYLDQAIQARPDYPAALFNRGLVYQKLSMGSKDPTLVDKSIADYSAALRSERSAGIQGDLLKALADAHNQKGEYAKAIAFLEQYLQTSPHAPDAALVDRKIRGLQLMQQSAEQPDNPPVVVPPESPSEPEPAPDPPALPHP